MSINVIPLLVYKMLNLGQLKPTNVVIQLENRSIANTVKEVEDVLVRVLH